MSTSSTPAPLLGEPLPVELMNTIWADREGVHDALDSPTRTAAWLRAVSARDGVDADALRAWLQDTSDSAMARPMRDLRALRDAVRRLAARRTGDTRPDAQAPIDESAALALVNQYAATSQSWPTLDWPEAGAPRRAFASSSDPGSVFVGDLARATVTLLAGESGGALRACYAPGCVLYFVRQHPRREWCSDVCGNRARQARHYRRHRGEQPPSS